MNEKVEAERNCDEKFNKIDGNLKELETKLSQMDGRLKEIYEKLDKLENLENSIQEMKNILSKKFSE